MTIDVSLLKLLFDASFVVQCVMLVLLLASIVSWAFIFQQGKFLQGCFTASENFECTFWSGIDLNKLYNKLCVQEKKLPGLEAVFVSGYKEFLRLQQHANIKTSVILESVDRAMRVALAKELQDMETHLPFLATVQSMSPYIGLFGTVWGIMHAFRELGAVQQATIGMVAPGISEALIATAMGLIAAIPAGIAYNRFINRVDRLSVRYNLFLEELTNILYRRVHVQ
jgi:biopolymer transport protein TolQ